jgi:uncharacterized protein (TIGR02001 family)
LRSDARSTARLPRPVELLWRGRDRGVWIAWAITLACGNADAADIPAAASPASATALAAPSSTASGFNGDIDLYTDYIERGLSYSKERLSLQGRVEYDFSGLYGGLALADKADVVDKETVDVDPYAGYRTQFNDWTIDVGVFSWLYIHSRFDVSNNRYNTAEATLDVTYKVFGVKLSYDILDYWGLDSASAAVNYHLVPKGSSRGSTYIESHASLPLSYGFSVDLHAGHQFIRNYGELDYSDWLVGLEKTLGHGFTIGGAYTDTNADEALYVDSQGRKLGRGKWFAYARWAFR